MQNAVKLAVVKYGVDPGSNLDAGVKMALAMEHSRFHFCADCAAVSYCMAKVSDPRNCSADFMAWAALDPDEPDGGAQ